MIKNQSWRNIPGWFNFQEFYEQTVKELSNKSTIVELGTWLGSSLCFLVHAAEENNKQFTIYSVDTWNGADGDIEHEQIINAMGGSDRLYEKFLDNMLEAGCLSKIIPLRTTTIEASKQFKDNSIDFIYVDAGHLYHEVKADMEAWWPKLKVGGRFAGHDYFYGEPTSIDGVIKAVNEFVQINQNNIQNFINYPEQRVWTFKKI